MKKSPSSNPTDYQSFFELSLEMLATITFDGSFKTLNEAFEQILGYSRGELSEHTFVDLVHPDDQAATLAALNTLVSGVGVHAFENRYRRRDGTYCWLRWSAVSSIEQTLIYAVAQDVTEIHAKDEALAQVISQLERSNEELLQFAYIASHDLSEPLRVVAGHVELIARRYRGQLDSDADRYIEFAVSGCMRMRALIDDLLAFSRASSTSVTTTEVDLDKLVQEMLASIDPLIEETHAVITVGPLPTIVGSHSQLTQVLANLVTNALKFRQPEAVPHVTISGEREEGAWRIKVQDDGIGIEPQYRERIFRMFQRLHNQSEYSGTGIGLAISRKMVELQGGRIWCTSAEPHGTTFCFTVPDRDGGSRQ